MASKYFRLSSLSRSSDLRDEDDEIEAAAAICMLQQKRRRGGVLFQDIEFTTVIVPVLINN